MITWKQIIETEAQKEYYKKLIRFIEDEAKTKTIFPSSEKRFSFMNQTPISAIKVVIIGQDPYHDDHQAHGLAFSVENKPYPPSYKCQVKNGQKCAVKIPQFDSILTYL